MADLEKTINSPIEDSGNVSPIINQDNSGVTFVTSDNQVGQQILPDNFNQASQVLNSNVNDENSPTEVNSSQSVSSNEVFLGKYENETVNNVGKDENSHLSNYLPEVSQNSDLGDSSPNGEQPINFHENMEEKQNVKLLQKEKLLQLIKIREGKAQKVGFGKGMLSGVILTIGLVVLAGVFAKDQIVNILSESPQNDVPLLANVSDLSSNCNDKNNCEDITSNEDIEVNENDDVDGVDNDTDKTDVNDTDKTDVNDTDKTDVNDTDKTDVNDTDKTDVNDTDKTDVNDNIGGYGTGEFDIEGGGNVESVNPVESGKVYENVKMVENTLDNPDNEVESMEVNMEKIEDNNGDASDKNDSDLYGDLYKDAKDLSGKLGYTIKHVNSEREANWVLPSHCSDLTCYGENKEFTPCIQFKKAETIGKDANRIGNSGTCRYKDESELVYVEFK